MRDIVRLLAWQFSKPVIRANLVAWPIARWVMRDWLNGFDAACGVAQDGPAAGATPYPLPSPARGGDRTHSDRQGAALDQLSSRIEPDVERLPAPNISVFRGGLLEIAL